MDHCYFFIDFDLMMKMEKEENQKSEVPVQKELF